MERILKTHCPKGHEYTSDNIYISHGNPKWRLCKICTKARSIARYKKLKGTPKFREACRRAGHKHSLNKTGWSIEAYDAALIEQRHVCAICSGKDRHHLAGDHDHKTNTARGLLCENCNRGLGLFKDSPIRLNKAIAYLKKHGKKDTD